MLCSLRALSPHPSFTSPHVSAGLTQSTINPLLVKLCKSKITAHLHSFVPHFVFPTFGINFQILFNLILPSRSSRHLFTIISDCPLSKAMIFLGQITFQLASKTSHRLGILRCIKSFLGTPELLFTYKAFICSLMEWKQSSSRLFKSPTISL